MKIYKNFNLNKTHKNSIILIGNFDGVHLGHRKLFNFAKKYKKKYSSKIGVLTFEPMPKMFFNKNLDNFRISNLQQKIDNLNTDIKGANLLNFDSLLISNGIHKNEIEEMGIEKTSKSYEAICNYIQCELKW